MLNGLMRQGPAQVLIASVSDALLEGAPAETQHNNGKREGFRRFSASLRKKRGEQLLLVGVERLHVFICEQR